MEPKIKETPDTAYEKGVLAMGSKIAEGQMPTSEQIGEAVQKTKETLLEQKQELRSGQPRKEEVGKFIDTTVNVIESAEKLVSEKNEDKLIQKTLSEFTLAGEQLAQKFREMKFEDVGLSREDFESLKEKSVNMIILLRGLSLQLIRSPEIRGLFLDMLNLFQRIFLRNILDVKEQGQQKTDTITAPLEKAAEGKKAPGEAIKESASLAYGTAKVAVSELKEGQWRVASEEEKREFREKLSELFTRVSKHRNFQRAIQNISDLWENIYNRFRILKDLPQYKELKEGKWNLEQFTFKNETLQQALRDVKTLIERFTNNLSLDNWINAFRDEIYFISSNETLRTYSKEFRYLFHRIEDNPEVINNEDFKQQTSDLINRADDIARLLNQNRYSERLWRESRALIDGIQNDSTTKQFVQQSSNWINQFFKRTETGEVKFDSDFLLSLRSVIVPLIMDQFKTLPLPPFSYDDGAQEIVVFGSQLSFCEPPNLVEIKQFADVKMFAKQESFEQQGRIEIIINDIHTKVENLRYAIHRRSFPAMEDFGKAQLDISGVNLNIVLDTSHPTQKPYFALYSYECSIANLNISLEETQHSFIMGLMTTFYKNTLRRALERRIENEIAGMFDRIEYLLTQAIEKLPALQENISAIKENLPYVSGTRGSSVD